MSLPGKDTFSQRNPMERHSSRSMGYGFLQPEGQTAAFIMEAHIVDINLSTWTVDVFSQFDRKYFLNVQVASSYMNYVAGEGIYAFPEVGSKCLLCIPSDGPPPFILAFIMPAESRSVEEAGEADEENKNAYSYGGGRTRPKPGDIYMKGRDGNFCILHRGGVLQIGSTELAQRIYIPLDNIVTDISQNYRHYNSAGAINWGVSTSSGEDDPPTCWKQTLRLFANDEKATVRIAAGSFKDVVGEHPSGTGNQGRLDVLDIGKSNPAVVEVVIAPEEFGVDDASVTTNTAKSAKLRFMFDTAGGAYLGTVGNILLATKKKLVVRADGGIEFETDKGFSIKAGSTGRIEAKDSLELTGNVVRIQGGADPVAHVGSIVTLAIPPGTPLGSNGSGPVLANPLTITGVVTSGKPTILC